MWVLNCGGTFPCGIFESKEKANDIILKYKLSGCLSYYPLNKLIYEWVEEKGFFSPKNDYQKTAKFIGCFSSAYQEHYHYEDGIEIC